MVEIMDEIVYRPEKKFLETTNIYELSQKLNLQSIEELYEFADKERKTFWDAVVDHCDVSFFKPYTKTIEESEGKEWTKWFKGGTINLSYNCVEKYKESRDPAIICEFEDKTNIIISYADLDSKVGKLAAFLKNKGINRGERIGIFMPLIPEAIIAMYAIIRCGAVAVPMFSGYGRDAVETRIKDSSIRFLFTVGSYKRKGKDIQMANSVRGIEGVTLILKGSAQEGDLDYDLAENFNGYIGSEHMDSEEPAIILYTSGTTGKPKGTVHVHGGTTVNILKEVKYYLNFKENDVLFWITDLGWMMGPWSIIGANGLKGTIFLYPGAVDYPNEERVWDMVDRNKITILGLSPTFVRTMKFKGVKRKFNHIKAFASTGEPWDNESWKYLFEQYGDSKVPICNISGGTDIIGCFLASTPATPLKPRCLYRGLGMNVSVMNEKGDEVFNEVGYLVSKSHCPSMTRGILGDNSRYIQSYWSKFKGNWYQGDWAEMHKDGYFFLYGRADEVIKVAGKRVGPNEIEDSVNSVKGVVESAATGIPDPIKGEAITIFYTGKPGDDTLRSIKMQVEKDLGKSFSPKYVFHMEALPKTRSGKIMRRVIKSTFLGESPGDLTGIDDPSILEKIKIMGVKTAKDKGAD